METAACQIPTVVLDGLLRGVLLTATDVAKLFGRETRSVKRWLLRSSFPRPDMIVDIPFGPRAGRDIRVWQRTTIENWWGGPIGPGQILTTADIAKKLERSVRDIKRFMANGDGHLVPPRRVIVMKSRSGSERSIRLWDLGDFNRWYDLEGEQSDLDEFGEEDELATGNPSTAPQVKWAYDIPYGQGGGFIAAPTKSEARALIKQKLGYAKNARLPVGTMIQQVHGAKP